MPKAEPRRDTVDAVVRELRGRGARPPAPRLIGRAVDGVEAELAAVRRQLGRRLLNVRSRPAR